MSPKKILLAEDDADDQKFFYEFLKMRTDVILLPVAENGEEIFDSLSNLSEATNLPDLIVLDQNMPKRNGLQTLQRLKDSRNYKRIPVFIYSTYADDALRQQSMAAGATFVFSKPYTSEGYHAMINAMLNFLR
jgi:CheY-like chemotaxis protein